MEIQPPPQGPRSQALRPAPPPNAPGRPARGVTNCRTLAHFPQSLHGFRPVALLARVWPRTRYVSRLAVYRSGTRQPFPVQIFAHSPLSRCFRHSPTQARQPPPPVCPPTEGSRPVRGEKWCPPYIASILPAADDSLSCPWACPRANE